MFVIFWMDLIVTDGKAVVNLLLNVASNIYLLVTLLSVDVEREETASHTKLVVQTHGVQDTHQMSNVQ
jgi:hypothetical protein